MPKPKRDGVEPPVEDALSQEISAGKESASKDLRLIMSGVGYGLFMDADPPLPLDTFMELRVLAMAKRFFSLTRPQLAVRLGTSLKGLTDLEEHVHFAAVDAALVDSAKRLAGVKSLDDMAKLAEVDVAKELFLVGTTSGTREKMKALSDLADRRSPKKGRDSGQQNARVFPENVLELIRLGLELGREHRPIAPSLPAEDDDVVDAEILNVPRAALPAGKPDL